MRVGWKGQETLYIENRKIFRYLCLFQLFFACRIHWRESKDSDKMLSSLSPWLHIWVDGKKWELSCLWEGNVYLVFSEWFFIFWICSVHQRLGHRTHKTVVWEPGWTNQFYQKSENWPCLLGVYWIIMIFTCLYFGAGDGIRWNDLIFFTKGLYRGWYQEQRKGKRIQVQTLWILQIKSLSCIGSI